MENVSPRTPTRIPSLPRRAVPPDHPQIIAAFRQLPSSDAKERLRPFVYGDMMRYDHLREETMRIIASISDGTCCTTRDVGQRIMIAA